MMDFNLESEERNGFTVSREMKKVWQTELDLLQRLIDVCREHHLRVWADGGTLLGAVRHQGFIPWDDDIDVCMPRQDYDRLIEIGSTAFCEPYFLQSAYSDTGYYRGHAQLRNSATTAIRPSDSYRPFNQGIFIDIFPIDAVPDGDTQLLKVCLKSVRRTLRFLKAANTPVFVSGRWGLVFRKMRARQAVKRQGWTAIFRQAEDKLRTIGPANSHYVAELGFSGDDILFERSIFSDTTWLPFENISIPVPAGYDLMLRTQYGPDYMTPQQAPSCHGELLFDTTRSYRELLPEAQRQYRNAQLRKLFGKR
jgi:lipopolysaccharide cholinephosphotransferase